MTGDVLRKLDAKQRSMQQKLTRSDKAPPPSEKSGASATVSSESSAKITTIHKLAVAYHTQKNYEEAERLYNQSLVAMEAGEDPKDPEFAQLLNNLGRLYFDQKRYHEAEPLYTRSLSIVEQSLGRDHPKVARRLANLADLHFATGKHSEADACYRRAISIEEQTFGPEHPTTVGRLRSYAAMLRKMNRVQEAAAVDARAYFPRLERDRRSVPDRRIQEVPTALQGISMHNRRRSKTRRSGKTRRRS